MYIYIPLVQKQPCSSLSPQRHSCRNFVSKGGAGQFSADDGTDEERGGQPELALFQRLLPIVPVRFGL